MKKVGKIIFFTLCLGTSLVLGACSSIGSGPKYIPRPDIPLSQYTPANWAEDAYDRVAYNEYEQREQCQQYRRIPRNSILVGGCDAFIAPEPAPVAMTVETTNSVVAVQPPPVAPAAAPVYAPVATNYTVYFNWDRANVRPSDYATMDEIARRIQAYNYRYVNVIGHADRSGSVPYNQGLSERRAASVSNMLTQRGVSPSVINTSGRGELEPAVPTADGVRLQENRRVVVDLK